MGNLNALLSLVILLCLSQLNQVQGAWKQDDKVLLKDIEVLTLYAGRMTSGRRAAPVQQLKCVGGSASNSYVPQVVQCYNRGSDGVDVQWECKADMDNAYRFGKVEVICEGYDYPEDPYILKGSCGLEYTLDLTKEGYQQQSNSHHQHHDHNYYGDNSGHHGHHHSDGYSHKHSHKQSTGFGDLIMLVIVGVIIYGVYRTCIAGSDQNTSDWQDGNTRRPPPRTGGPPPPGFRDDYMPGGNDDNCHSTRTNTNTNHGASTGAGGFWGGAATGGILGYLFGSRTNTGYGSYQQPYHRPYGGGWGSGWGSGWGNRGFGSGGFGSGWGSSTRTSYSSGGGGSSFGGSSTGTRTASGFGGTRRR